MISVIMLQKKHHKLIVFLLHRRNSKISFIMTQKTKIMRFLSEWRNNNILVFIFSVFRVLFVWGSALCFCDFYDCLLISLRLFLVSYDYLVIYSMIVLCFLWYCYDVIVCFCDCQCMSSFYNGFRMVFMICVWFAYGFPMMCVWFVYDLLMIVLWCAYDLPIFPYEFPLIVLWLCMLFYDFLWIYGHSYF